MEITSTQKFIHNTPRKLMLVADMVRKQSPTQALVTLQFTPKAATVPLSKAIKTALANAVQLNANVDNLVFKKIEINEGPVIKRARSMGRGFVGGYKKRMSHIKIVLSDELEVKSPKLKVKSEIKKEKIKEGEKT